MCGWVAMLGSGKLTEHCGPAVAEKNKNHKKKKKKRHNQTHKYRQQIVAARGRGVKGR